MGILDSIASQVLGGAPKSDLINAVVGMLGNQSSGGIGGLVQQFASKGLGDIVNSWVSTGQNLPVTPGQIQQGLGDNVISQLAAKVGLSPDQAASHLSQILPQVVDKLTPDGKVPQGDLLSKGLGALTDLMK